MSIPQITNTETLGLEAVTIFNDKPYFFLFSDIDSSDQESLIKVLKYYQKWHLSCYYYQTTKGFHIISPVLLTFRTWLFRTESLRKIVPDYRFGAIRISKRNTDSKSAFYQNWNDKKFKESGSLHSLMNELYFIDNVKMVKPKKTKLNYIWYNQLNFKSLTTIESGNTCGFCIPPDSVLLQERDLLCQGVQTFDQLYTTPVTFEECQEAQL